MFKAPKNKTALLAATGLAAAMMCAPALAQETTAEPATTAAEKAATAKAEASSDVVVIVRGVRGSMKDSADKKRRSKQISDSVSAEDAGKLPDNNVTEALAHVTGVQITRKHGEGADMAIRGIQEVGTTVNGNAAGGGNMRSMNHNAENGAICTTAINFGECQDQGPTLSDVPAALIKSVTVYKTRTADQIEGGIGGVVNVELRRPLDLKKGWTIAGAYRNSYNSIGDTESPTASLLVANRFDTPIGEMGFLANFGYSKNNYEEQHLVTETVRNFYGNATINGQPGWKYNPILGGTLTPAYVTAYRVWNGLQDGTNERPTANLAYQWRVNDNLDFVVEGSWFGSKEGGENDYMSVITGEGSSAQRFDDVVTQADGVTIKSMTINNPNGVPFSMWSSYWARKMDTYSTNFETHYHKDKLQINGSVQYNWTNMTSNNLSQQLAVTGLNTIGVDFDNGSAHGVLISLPNPAALRDPANYTFTQLHHEVAWSDSRDFNGQLDLTYSVSDDWLVRSIQTGFRVSSKFVNNYFAYRDATFKTPLKNMPTADTLVNTTLGNNAFSASSFYHLSGEALLANFDDVRAFAVANMTNPSWGGDWSLPVPSDRDHNSYGEKEFTRAWYGQLNLAFDALFPVDGIIGVRTVATDGMSLNTRLVDGEAISNDTPAKSFHDAMPNASATIHFKPNLQLRLSYDVSVQRPAFSQLSSAVHIDTTNKSGWGGNADLKPMKGPNYDASLEYYFGHGGVASFAAYLKKPEGQLFWQIVNKTAGELGVSGVDPATIFNYTTPYNAGQGTYQGYEFNVQGFFEFLPSFWKNFGAGFNYTYNQVFKLDIPNDPSNASAGSSSFHGPWTSKDTYNLQVYYDTPEFNARVAYNFRSKFYGDPNTDFPNYTYTNGNTSRLDASIAYTPVKWMTLTLEGTNLLNNNQIGYYGYEYFNAETRLQGRTVQVGARFRY
ncbi:TonB-dependent receptor [Asticcacaulis benevestitus]|uniref:TonB-denpendent receptor n=1 Tax=Asticcacaulis benevestitus DSM 16100 = ATCC BAA-896 TaxID=1121022 RepID=V4PS78_9CAUL|nr:TonB-dependent receptor [Asticcacaulis benevestitus]ESQ91151.1 hypothetical protein ABENE_10865 [Asticcacaulis benevestitus DSM 16100 = ATCC BAA-896]